MRPSTAPKGLHDCSFLTQAMCQGFCRSYLVDTCRIWINIDELWCKATSSKFGNLNQSHWGRCPPDESSFLVRSCDLGKNLPSWMIWHWDIECTNNSWRFVNSATPPPPFKTLAGETLHCSMSTSLNIDYECWKIHGPWQWDSPW